MKSSNLTELTEVQLKEQIDSYFSRIKKTDYSAITLFEKDIIKSIYDNVIVVGSLKNRNGVELIIVHDQSGKLTFYRLAKAVEKNSRLGVHRVVLDAGAGILIDPIQNFALANKTDYKKCAFKNGTGQDYQFIGTFNTIEEFADFIGNMTAEEIVQKAARIKNAEIKKAADSMLLKADSAKEIKESKETKKSKEK